MEFLCFAFCCKLFTCEIISYQYFKLIYIITIYFLFGSIARIKPINKNPLISASIIKITLVDKSSLIPLTCSIITIENSASAIRIIKTSKSGANTNPNCFFLKSNIAVIIKPGKKIAISKTCTGFTNRLYSLTDLGTELLIC